MRQSFAGQVACLSQGLRAVSDCRTDSGAGIRTRSGGGIRTRSGVAVATVVAAGLLLGPLTPARAAVSPLSFSAVAGSPLTVGANPAAVAVADLNGDGKPDLVVANSADNTVSVLLGNGDGTFKAQVTYPTGVGPNAVAVADLNGDGKPDLVVTNAADGTVSVLLGNGDGTFKAKVDYPTGGAPDALAVADLNGDGKPDLVVANFASSTVSVLVGNGDGTFKAKVDYPTGAGPTGLAVSDLNGDKKLDVVTANDGANTASVLLGHGDGTLAANVDYPTGAAPASVAIGDLNGDGKPDLAVADSGANAVSVLLANGDGTFKTKVDYPTGIAPAAVVIGDLNADKRSDLVTANSGASSASILLGNGDGTFATKQDLVAGADPVALALGDLNGDGKPDVVLVDHAAAEYSLLLNNSLPTVDTTAITAFGTQLFGTKSPAQKLTLTNNGSAALAIKTVTAPANFAASGCAATTLAAGGSCSISVTFAPKGYGSLSGNLTIATNAPGSPTTVPLLGTGLPPVARVFSLLVTPGVGSYATLNGSVISQGPGSFYFEYGTSPAYGSVTPTLPLSSSTSTQLLATTIPVNAGYTYHYQIVAANLLGTVLGGDQVFSSPPDPPVLTAAVGQAHLLTVLGKGLPVRLTQDSPATVKVSVSVDAKIAHAAHIVSRTRTSTAPFVIGKADIQTTAGNPARLVVSISRQSAKGLARLKRVTFTIDAHALSVAKKAGSPTEISLTVKR